MKPMIVAGTRPEMIKLAPLILELESRGIKSIVIHTGQHEEMANQALALFGIKPTETWHIMENDQSPANVVRRVWEHMPGALDFHKPDVVIVQGDTSTAVAAAQAAFYDEYDVAHVEAGLRTFDASSPRPEEVNRAIIDNVSKLLFCPTNKSVENLPPSRYSIPYVTGNTGIDAARLALTMKPAVSYDEGWHSRTWLITTHRRENLVRLPIFLRNLNEIEDVGRLFYSVHPNPAVQRMVRNNGRGIFLDPPLDFVSFIHLMKKMDFVVTDSGGIQEEAVYMGIPVYVLRDSTERMEGVNLGAAELLDITDKAALEHVIAYNPLLGRGCGSPGCIDERRSAYGDGHAATKIVDILKEHYD